MGTCCTTIAQSEVGVMESCGKFNGTASPGFHCLGCCWNEVVARISIRLQELQMHVESKTKDNVFVNVSLTLQLQVIPDRIEEMHYRALNPYTILKDNVCNSIRAKIPLYKLEALYIERGTISQQIKSEVDLKMENYGMEIVSVLISDINPGVRITNTMNEIQRLQRLRVASVGEAETKKLQRVRAAEAQCDARRLAGEGLAEQRKAIVAGLMESVNSVQGEISDLSTMDATNMLIMNQYYDTLQNVAVNAKSTLMLLEATGGLEKAISQLKTGALKLMK
ncbi:unnamed protein product [Phytomonas sp. Hart1]|nr:unnamed protein product [Phytomonas sp. Hart1]|eukprot:CCW71877.1 unnamed protein product [Phytomonas sp. isolate Hart1]